jgi:hypothetical protein
MQYFRRRGMSGGFQFEAKDEAAVIRIVVPRDCNPLGVDTVGGMMVRTPSAFFSFLWTTFCENDSLISHWEHRKRLVPDWQQNVRVSTRLGSWPGRSSPLFPKSVNVTAYEGKVRAPLRSPRMYDSSIFLRQFNGCVDLT